MQDSIQEKIQRLNNTADPTSEYDAKDIDENKLMALLAYFPLLFLIPWFVSPSSKFARFHALQGITLSILYGAYIILSIVLSFIRLPHTSYVLGFAFQTWRTPVIIFVIIFLLFLPLAGLSALGAVNAGTGKAKELPLIGKIKFMK